MTIKDRIQFMLNQFNHDQSTFVVHGMFTKKLATVEPSASPSPKAAVKVYGVFGINQYFTKRTDIDKPYGFVYNLPNTNLWSYYCNKSNKRYPPQPNPENTVLYFNVYRIIGELELAKIEHNRQHGTGTIEDLKGFDKNTLN